MTDLLTQPVVGDVMAPKEDKAQRAAMIICGHDFVYKDLSEDKAAEFYRFVLKVLRTEWL